MNKKIFYLPLMLLILGTVNVYMSCLSFSEPGNADSQRNTVNTPQNTSRRQTGSVYIGDESIL